MRDALDRKVGADEHLLRAFNAHPLDRARGCQSGRRPVPAHEAALTHRRFFRKRRCSPTSRSTRTTDTSRPPVLRKKPNQTDTGAPIVLMVETTEYRFDAQASGAA